MLHVTIRFSDCDPLRRNSSLELPSSDSGRTRRTNVTPYVRGNPYLLIRTCMYHMNWYDFSHLGPVCHYLAWQDLQATQPAADTVIDEWCWVHMA